VTSMAVERPRAVAKMAIESFMVLLFIYSTGS
jgi:hypothetical protein